VCEIAFVAAVERHQGIGSSLLGALRREVADCERMWLVTTNDNLEALRFSQRRGFVLSAFRAGAIDDARRELKPTISRVGNFDTRSRDELELEARITHTYGSAHMAATPIPHFAAASLMRPLTIPHGTRNGFFVHWISSSSDLAS
jgi:hypothetical protein